MDKVNGQCVLPYQQAEGDVAIRMTNDYLFRALLQMNENVRKAFVGSLLHLTQEQILSTDIENPIELGTSVKDKEYFLDVKLSLNDHTIVNLELQVLNWHNWTERSMLYMCRAFDNVNRSEDYLNVRPVVQISLLDFSIWRGKPEFYASYMLMNEKTHWVYSEKLQLKVLELKQSPLATEEDRKWQLDKWARFFKSTTWEELKTLAEELPILHEAAQTVYHITQDERIRQQCEAREEYYRMQRTTQKLFERQKQQLEEQGIKIEEQGIKIEEQGIKIEEQDTTIEEQGIKIEEQAKQLNKKEQELQEQQQKLANRNHEIIANALQMGMQIDEIANLTGLSTSDIEKLT